jgi:ubiquinone/menaquinone biosynthesis C-methylase UbiE
MQTENRQDEKYRTWYETKITLQDPWYKLILRMLKPVVADLKGKRVLEVGCGLGVFCTHIAREDGEAIGLDISKSAILKAKDLSRQFGVQDKVEFVVTDARFLPFVERSQDIIVCSEVLEHIENHQQAFHEFARVADNSGYIVLTVPNLISSLFFEVVFFMVMGQPKYVQKYLNVEKEYVFHYFKVKRLVNSENLTLVDIRGTDYVHVHPKIIKFLKLAKISNMVSSELENKKSWRFLGANIGVVAQKNLK